LTGEFKNAVLASPNNYNTMPVISNFYTLAGEFKNYIFAI